MVARARLEGQPGLRRRPGREVKRRAAKNSGSQVSAPRDELYAAQDVRYKAAMAKSRIKTVVNWLLFLLAVVSVVVAVVQSRRVNALEQERNAQLAAAHAQQQQIESEQTQRQQQAEQELAQLRKGQEELLRLRAEVQRLRPQTNELARLRAENQRLGAELQRLGADMKTLQEHAATLATALSPDPPANTPQDRTRAQSIQCVSHLKQIGLGAHMWALDHGDVFPSDFLTMSNELVSPKILVCPSDTVRPQLSNWTQVNAASVTYQMVSPGMKEGEPQRIFVTCPIHGHVGLGDGSVQQAQSAK